MGLLLVDMDQYNLMTQLNVEIVDYATFVFIKSYHVGLNVHFMAFLAGKNLYWSLNLHFVS